MYKGVGSNFNNEYCRFSVQLKFVFMSTFTKIFLRKEPHFTVSPLRPKRKVGFDAVDQALGNKKSPIFITELTRYRYGK
jgi:hypothetical protein